MSDHRGEDTGAYILFYLRNVPCLGKGRYGKDTCHDRHFFLFSLAATTTDLRPLTTRRKRVKMPPDTRAQSKHSPADQEDLKGLPNRQLMDFRDYVRRCGIVTCSDALFTRQASYSPPDISLSTQLNSLIMNG